LLRSAPGLPQSRHSRSNINNQLRDTVGFPASEIKSAEEANMMGFVRDKLAAPIVALAIGGVAASGATPATAKQIWRSHSAGLHSGGWHGGWNGGGWHGGGHFNNAFRGGNRDQGGFGGYALGLGALGALEGYQAYYNDDCVRYRPMYNRYGHYIGRRAVRIC
jgi:hypothetical protein